MTDLRKMKNGNPKYHVKDTSDLKALFQAADSQSTIDGQIKNSSLKLLQEAIDAKEVRLISDKRKIWQSHMRYADKEMWIFHIFYCILMLSSILVVNHTTVVLSMLLSSALGSLSVLEVGRICFAKLSELSETCFFNVRQMAAFDMVFSGILNLAALSFGILLMSSRWQVRLVQIGLYVLVPFIFTQCVCLGVLLTEAGRRNTWITVGTGILLTAFFAFLSSIPWLYMESALLFWGIALIAGIAILGIQVRTLFSEIGKGDILCTN